MNTQMRPVGTLLVRSSAALSPLLGAVVLLKLRNVLLLPLLLGCASIDSAINSAAGTPEAASANRPFCASDDDGKRWDLGTGYALDVRHTAPGFLSLREDGWKTPDQPWAVDQSVQDQQRFGTANQRRLDALRVNAKGIEPKPSQVDDIRAFDLVSKPASEYKIRRFLVGSTAAILITPGTCEHIVAVDHCNGGRLTTEVTTASTIKCVGPFTAPDYMMIASEPTGPKVRLDFRRPLVDALSGSHIFMFAPDGKPLGQAERGIDQYADAVPDEVLATLALETEQPASSFWKNVPDALRTDAVVAQVANARVAATTAAAGQVHDPQAALQFGANRRINGTLPGDEAVAAIVRAKLIEGAKQLTEPTPEKFRLGISLIKLLKLYKGTAEDVQATGIEAAYGSAFVSGTLNDPKDRQAFLTTFPTSERTEKLLALMQKEADADDAREAAQKKESEVSYDFAELADDADKIIMTKWQARFVLSHLDMMRNQRRSLAGADAFKSEAERMQREDFCPARREFVKKYGGKELQDRAKEKCENGPPTVNGDFGREVRLDKECRAIFASGC